MSLKIFNSKKKIFLIITILFLSILIVSPVFAAAGDYIPLVAIPGVSANAGLFAYLSGVYSFLISIVGILAMAVLVYGGMRYITSAGNTASVDEAKESINAALAGLILALVSWLIFATINKDILVLKNPGVNGPIGVYGINPLAKCTAAPGDGTPGYPCHCIDAPEVPITGSGADCNAICSDPNAFHCISAEVRIGWVGNPSDYTDNQLRALAINTGTDANPFVAYSGSYYVLEVEKYSKSLYPITSYTHDTNEDMVCEAALTNIGWNKATAVFTNPVGPACHLTSTPVSEVCSQRFCITDSQGHTASALIYYAIRSN